MFMKKQDQKGIGNRLAPPHFILFGAIAIMATPVAIMASDWRMGSMLGFDVAALVFILSLFPLYRHRGDAKSMREAALRNDANRAGLLFLSALVTTVILVAIAAELTQKKSLSPAFVALIVATLALSWIFSNLVYALHYAHLYYSPGEKGDAGGIAIPGVDEPDYWDFTYYAFTLGMTFQTSDVSIEDAGMRRVVLAQSLVAFVFNIGILAFTISTLSS